MTHYVKEGSRIDEEASKRGTSVYLADRRIDMLPKMLTENVCSLVSDGQRFCFSVIYLVDTELNIIHERFCKSVIHNKANLTYEEAYKLIIDENN